MYFLDSFPDRQQTEEAAVSRHLCRPFSHTASFHCMLHEHVGRPRTCRKAVSGSCWSGRLLMASKLSSSLDCWGLVAAVPQDLTALGRDEGRPSGPRETAFSTYFASRKLNRLKKISADPEQEGPVFDTITLFQEGVLGNF